jgi:threonine/homoserine/homoserine lactone efflux protein
LWARRHDRHPSFSAPSARPWLQGEGREPAQGLIAMEWHNWLIYLAAATGLSLSPGPNGLLALTHGALHGRRKALFTIAGGAFGFVAVIALSMFGIGALLKTSLLWLTVMKWLGGAYLVWLGIQVWRSPPIGVEAGLLVAPRAGGSLFRQGALAALTNPKGLLFFAAFLPQFIDPARSLVLQFAVMAGSFAAIEVATELFIAGMAHRISPWLHRVGRHFNQVCGGIFVAIGVALPLRG